MAEGWTNNWSSNKTFINKKGRYNKKYRRKYIADGKMPSTCELCDRDLPLSLDHITPLWILLDEKIEEGWSEEKCIGLMSFVGYKESNIQWICEDCRIEKNKEENKEKIRRGRQ